MEYRYRWAALVAVLASRLYSLLVSSLIHFPSGSISSPLNDIFSMNENQQHRNTKERRWLPANSSKRRLYSRDPALKENRRGIRMENIKIYPEELD